LFHPADALSEATAAGKLPLTLYETVYENATGAAGDKAMDIDSGAQSKTLKFRELVYSIETGEAEMIGVDFVARGGGNATAVEASSGAGQKAESSKLDETVRKGKGKAKAKEEVIEVDKILTAEDEEGKCQLRQLTLSGAELQC
jgi:COP9 signalosome complex subunit 6